MPVIVIGADTELGTAVLARLQARPGEVRAFVSDPQVSQGFRSRGVKVAVGDVSDFSHVGAAALGAFSAVLVAPAATDGRETAFSDPRQVVEGWIEVVADAGVSRIILVGDLAQPLSTRSHETAVVTIASKSPEQVADEVADLDDTARL